MSDDDPSATLDDRPSSHSQHAYRLSRCLAGVRDLRLSCATSTARADDCSFGRQTSGVTTCEYWRANAWRRTLACGIASSTDSGTSATPAPAPTQATMA